MQPRFSISYSPKSPKSAFSSPMARSLTTFQRSTNALRRSERWRGSRRSRFTSMSARLAGRVTRRERREERCTEWTPKYRRSCRPRHATRMPFRRLTRPRSKRITARSSLARVSTKYVPRSKRLRMHQLISRQQEATLKPAKTFEEKEI